MTPTGTTTSI